VELGCYHSILSSYPIISIVGITLHRYAYVLCVYGILRIANPYCIPDRPASTPQYYLVIQIQACKYLMLVLISFPIQQFPVLKILSPNTTMVQDGNPLAMLLWLLSLLLPTLVMAHPQGPTRSLPSIITHSTTVSFTSTFTFPITTFTDSVEPVEPTRPPKYPPILDCDSLVHPCYTFREEKECSWEWFRLLRM
jgi:hypothetical protein